MLPLSSKDKYNKNPDLGDQVLRYLDCSGVNEEKTYLLFAVPGAILFLMYVLNVNAALKYSFLTLVISACALYYAFLIFVQIMKKDPGTREMQDIADAIQEGADGFFVAQYGSIMKLSGVFSFGIMLLYYCRKNHDDQLASMMGNFTMGLFQGLAFLFGALSSAFSGYAGIWVSVRANTRVASAARTCYNEAL